MEFGDAEKHTAKCLGVTTTGNADEGNINGFRQQPADFWGEEVVKVVERRAKEVARQRAWVM
jgi:hypothetical protein